MQQHTLRRVLRTNNTYGVEYYQPTFAVEEVGVLILEMAQQLEDREARLTMIQQVIEMRHVCSSDAVFTRWLLKLRNGGKGSTKPLSI